MTQTTSRCLLLLSGLLTLIGCGYQQSGAYDGKPQQGYKWHSLYREDIHTVAVPIFKNQDFTRGVEFSLTTALVKQIEAHTPYKVVSRERAQTIIEGEITTVRKQTLSRDRNTGLPQEQMVTVTVNFLWKDLRTGKILVQRKNFDQSAPYYPTLGEGQFIGNQDTVEKLALGIVEELQADW